MPLPAGVYNDYQFVAKIKDIRSYSTLCKVSLVCRQHESAFYVPYISSQVLIVSVYKCHRLLLTQSRETFLSGRMWTVIMSHFTHVLLHSVRRHNRNNDQSTDL